MKYVSVSEMIAIEKAADTAGQSYTAMMEAAGKGLATLIQERYGSGPGSRVAALVGSGNNGGDALVALDYLLSWGWTAEAIFLRKRLKTDPLIQRIINRGATLIDYFNPESSSIDLRQHLAEREVVIDGVLGTGIKLPLRPPLGDLIGNVKQVLDGLETKPMVVAVDCPSGVDCDTGEVSPVCLRADLTVTMAAVKAGTLNFPAYEFLGELEMVEIGLPPNLPELDKITREIVEEKWVQTRLPNRPLDAHKGTFGTSLVVAGSEEFPGAAVLAGKSAYRIGCGLVTMAVPRGIYQGLIKTIPEATWLVLEEESGGISEYASEQIKQAIGKPTACLIGPGFGTRAETRKFLKKIIQLEGLPPLVVDADALRLLSEIQNWQELLPSRSVLTPHPGEMAALSGLSVEEIQQNRVLVAEEYARDWDQIVVLKGAHSIIAAPEGRTKILISANPALARAGSGDVLAGIITGLIAQGLTSFDAAVSGCWIHAAAGKKAAQINGSPAAVLAGDISRSIGLVLPG
jgi:NAD(P)H-hydrate epimerase